MIKRINYLILLIIICKGSILSQSNVQTIRGVIYDDSSEQPLTGVNIVISGTDPLVGTISDNDGEFEIKDIPVGRVSLNFTYLGYEPLIMNGLVLVSGKELVLNVKMTESVIRTNEVVVSAYNKSETINSMAMVSARSFSIEETEKYAGSLGDPSRMAQNFAGVFSAGDQRNDIIIRGNSPSGLLWRLDGVNIPNPNHFGALGSTGGPISILNNNLLANSDFFTSAWPAEYGNALSGVFDLNMRAGNNKNREYLFQVGFNGFELGAEGPFIKDKNSSYLINYRNSTIDVLNQLGFEVAGGSIPKYQDLSFKFNFPTSKAGKFSISGITGNSEIYFDHNNEDGSTYDIPSGTDTRNEAGMMTYSINHTIFLDEKSRFVSFLNYSRSNVRTTADQYESVSVIDTIHLLQTGDTVYKNNTKKTLLFHENNSEYRISAGTKFKSKINSMNFIDFGISADQYAINYLDSVFIGSYYGWGDAYVKETEIDTSRIFLFQAYGQWNRRFSGVFSTIAGIHFQYMYFNESYSVEPRISARWQIADKQQLSFGYGLHSQMQSLFLYFARTPIDSVIGCYLQNNMGLDFTRAHHFVMTHDYSLFKNFRIKTEIYYQFLFDVPVEVNPSYYSVLNTGASFYQQRANNLENNGKGCNYGIELTAEKFLSSNYYFLVTTSLFDSKYITNENIVRNTYFANNYIVNCLAGREFSLGKNKTFSIDFKIVYAGGKRYVPMFVNQDNEVEYDYENAFKKHFPSYFRSDIRISLKVNMKKLSQEWAVDFQNFTDHENVYGQDFNEDTHEIYYSYQQGFYPMFLYRLNF